MYFLRLDYCHKTKLNKNDHIIIKTVSAILYLLYHAKGLVHASLCKSKGGYIVLFARTNYPPNSALLSLMAYTTPITQETRAQSKA